MDTKDINEQMQEEATEVKEINKTELENTLDEIKALTKMAGYSHIKSALTSLVNASVQEVINTAGLSDEATEKRLKAIGRIEAANMILGIENDIKQQLAAIKVQQEVNA